MIASAVTPPRPAASAGRALAALVAAAALLGCEAAPAPSGSAGTGVSTAPDGSPNASEAGSLSPSAPADAIVGPGELALPDPAVGLDTLTSYRATLTYAFDGTAGGQARTWTLTKSIAMTGQGSALTVESTGEVDAQLLAATSPWSGVLEGARYERLEGGECAASLAGPADAIERPAAELIALLGAERVGIEIVAGREVESYTFDQRALGFRGELEATGRISIVTAGGYVFRYDLALTGGPEYFGEDVRGTLTTTYAMLEFADVAPIELPAGCPPGRLVAALPSDATDITEAPGFLRYGLPGKVARAVDIVRGNAVLDHWTPIGKPRIVEGGAHLRYEGFRVIVDVWVRADGGGSLVEMVASWPE